MFIKLGTGRYIDSADISAVFDIDTLSGKKTNPFIAQIKEENKALELVDGKKVQPKSVVITKQGFVLLTRFAAETIITKIGSTKVID